MKFESVGLGKGDVLDFAVRICLFARYEVALRKHFRAVDFLETSRTDLRHNVRHLLHTVKTAEGYRTRFFDVVAESFVDVLKYVVNAFADRVEITHHFGKRHTCNDRVLIACVSTYQRTVTFFKSEKIGIFAALFPFLDFFADKLEAGQHVKSGYAVTRCQCASEFGGDDSFDERAVFWHSAGFFFAKEDVVCKKHADLIAVEQHEFALVVADCNAHSVRVGVCADDDVASDFVCKFNAESQGVRFFGIGDAHGRKLGVGQCLFAHDVDGDTHLFENCGDGDIAASVNRGVDDFYVFAELFDRFGRERKFANRVEITFVHALADDGDMLVHFHVVKPFYIVGGEIGVNLVYAEIRGFVYKFDHFIRRFGRHLRAVLAVNFVSVVDFGIVRSGYHNACDRI